MWNLVARFEHRGEREREKNRGGRVNTPIPWASRKKEIERDIYIQEGESKTSNNKTSTLCRCWHWYQVGRVIDVAWRCGRARIGLQNIGAVWSARPFTQMAWNSTKLPSGTGHRQPIEYPCCCQSPTPMMPAAIHGPPPLRAIRERPSLRSFNPSSALLKHR